MVSNTTQLPPPPSRTLSVCNVLFMYLRLRALLCTFQITVDFSYEPVGGRGGGIGGLDKGGYNLYCKGTVNS